MKNAELSHASMLPFTCEMLLCILFHLMKSISFMIHLLHEAFLHSQAPWGVARSHAFPSLCILHCSSWPTCLFSSSICDFVRTSSVCPIGPRRLFDELLGG